MAIRLVKDFSERTTALTLVNLLEVVTPQEVDDVMLVQIKVLDLASKSSGKIESDRARRNLC